LQEQIAKNNKYVFEGYEVKGYMDLIGSNNEGEAEENIFLKKERDLYKERFSLIKTEFK